MERQKSKDRYMKQKKKMKRRRGFWTFLFILIAAVLAYKAVSFGKEKLFGQGETPADPAVAASGENAATGGVGENTTTNGAGSENTSTEVASEPAGFVVKQADAWQYILVNKNNPVDENFAPPETYLLQEKYKSDLRIKEATQAMFSAAEADGVSLIACSGYRPYEVQEKLFNRKKAKFSHLSDEEAELEAAKSVAKPGTSEHQTGLALDIVTPSYTSLDEGYADTKAAKWLAANAYQYGFILRYPKDKTEITQIIFEPWHYRYVGKEAATIIFEEGLCYEEFYEGIVFE